MHNRYILERLYQINALLEEKSYCFERDCFLSQQGITEAQLLMSKRWVQHYARGPYYIAENKNELALRTSICRNTNPPVDIHSVKSRLRLAGRCLDIFGAHHGGAGGIANTVGGGAGSCGVHVPRVIVSDFVSSKNSMQLELVMSRVRASAHKLVRASAHKLKRSCVVS